MRNAIDGLLYLCSIRFQNWITKRRFCLISSLIPSPRASQLRIYVLKWKEAEKSRDFHDVISEFRVKINLHRTTVSHHSSFWSSLFEVGSRWLPWNCAFQNIPPSLLLTISPSWSNQDRHHSWTLLSYWPCFQSNMTKMRLPLLSQVAHLVPYRSYQHFARTSDSSWTLYVIGQAQWQ